jgi:hypothetical protein
MKSEREGYAKTLILVYAGDLLAESLGFRPTTEYNGVSDYSALGKPHLAPCDRQRDTHFLDRLWLTNWDSGRVGPFSESPQFETTRAIPMIRNKMRGIFLRVPQL